MGKSFKFNNDIYLDMCAILHPVGEIYITTDSNFNPNNNWVGTWELIKDKFLIGAGHNYNVNATGGEATHVLTTDELPSHTHGSETLKAEWTDRSLDSASTINKFHALNGNITRSNYSDTQGYYSTANRVAISSQYNRLSINMTHEHDSVGKSLAHNNLPPYIGVYMWHRIS